jgi:ATP-dependent Clp protease protease subunit
VFRLPQLGDYKQHLTNDNWEFATSYLSRVRRLLFLKGPMQASPDRVDVYSPGAVGDDILAYNVYDDGTGQRRPITLVIDSGGGEVGAGFQLFDYMNMSRSPITTIAMSVASMATIILMAGVRRLALPHARIMLHLPTIGGNRALDPKQAKIQEQLISKTNEELIEVYLNRGVTAGLSAGASRARIRNQIMKDIDREYWLNAAEALRYGLIDGIAAAEDLLGPEGAADASLIEVPKGY